MSITDSFQIAGRLTFRKRGIILVKKAGGFAMTKAEHVVTILTEKGWRISFAESCTGGLAAAELVSVASASNVFDASFVTYANEAKMKYLGVRPESIAQFGVVSEQVALEMALGAAAQAGAQVAVGISGIAGPSGAVPGKPVGTVCFGFVAGAKQLSVTKQFGSIGRNPVRKQSVAFVFDTLSELLSDLA